MALILRLLSLAAWIQAARATKLMVRGIGKRPDGAHFSNILSVEKLGGAFWKSDTYVGALKLTPSLLKTWECRRVIDVGSGLSLFSLEADLLGIHVDRFDLNPNDERISETQKAMDKYYAKNLELFDRQNQSKMNLRLFLPRYTKAEKKLLRIIVQNWRKQKPVTRRI